MKYALIFAVFAALANLFLILYVKKKNKTKADDCSNNSKKDKSHVFSKEYLNTPEVKRLKTLAAAELSISLEEIDRMSVEEIKQLAKKQKLINTE